MGAGLEGRSMRLRTPRGEVGEGGPCVSVLLFGGGGGGGKMAAHGGSAASSALKGLIQQFTAITGKRRGYRKVEGGVRSGRRVCPGLPLTFRHSSFGLSPQLPSSLLRKRRRRRRGLRVQAGDSPPRSRDPRSLSPSGVEGDPPAPRQPRPGNGPSPPPPPARGPGGGRSGGPHPGHRPPPPPSSSPFSVQPCGAVRLLTSVFLSSPARSSCPGPRPALPLSGPLGAIAVALAGSGPPAFTARPVGSAVSVHFPGDRPPEAGVPRRTSGTAA